MEENEVGNPSDVYFVCLWCLCVQIADIYIPPEMDLVTPLCSQVTYEGLLDDMFGIQCGYVEFGPEITQKDQPVKVHLSSDDEVRIKKCLESNVTFVKFRGDIMVDRAAN